MTDVIYTFGPYDYPVSIRAKDGSFAGRLPKGRTYTHIGDPGLEFRIRRVKETR